MDLAAIPATAPGLQLVWLMNLEAEPSGPGFTLPGAGTVEYGYGELKAAS